MALDDDLDAPDTKSDDPISVPQDATVEPPSPIPPAALVFGQGNKIVIGKPSQVHQRSYLLVGRQASTCDIRIGHKSLSRQHAILYYHPALTLVDLGTKSGTFVNSERITAQEAVTLQHGDTIQFGKAQPIFTVEWQYTVKKEEAKPAEVHQPQVVDNNDAIEEDNNDNDNDEDRPVLTAREQRQAEIAAMMATLDEAPTYTQYVPTAADLAPTPAMEHLKATKANRKLQALLDKYKLPLSDATPWAFVESQGPTNATNVTTVTAIAMEPSGARFAVGCMDSSLRLYDFGGMNADDPTPFQNTYVQEGYPVRSMAYSPSGDRYVVATGSSQPRLWDRNGAEEILEFVRGDVYVTDPAKTLGHTAAVTCVQWHPLEKSIVYTTSRDGSLRLWNVDSGKLAFGMLKCQDVVVIKNLQTGRKTIPTCMAITPKFIAMGTECGSVQIYAHPFVSKLRPQQSTIVKVDDGNDIAKDNTSSPAVLSVVYSVDGAKLACRTSKAVLVYGVSGSQRLSTSSTPLLTCTNVGTMEEADNSTPTMAFSPNGKVLCIGVTEQSTNEDKTLRFASRLDVYVVPQDMDDSNKKKKGPIFSQSLSDLPASDWIVGLSWHFKLNQLLVATTHSFQIWYSVDHSQKGVLLSCRQRRNKRKMEDDLQEMYQARAPPPGSNVRYDEIVAPNALPMFGGDSKQKRKQRKLEQQEEDNKRKNPQQPSKSVYNTPNTIFAQLVVDNQTVQQKVIAGIDPREALAKYSEGKSYISTAYEGNKERILADRTVEEEEDEMKKR